MTDDLSCHRIMVKYLFFPNIKMNRNFYLLGKAWEPIF